MRSAEKGPIVVLNVSTIQSDALIVETHEIHSLPLPLLKYSDLETHSKDFLSAINGISPKNYASANRRVAKVLEWLWDVAVGPVHDELGFTENLSVRDIGRECGGLRMD